MGTVEFYNDKLCPPILLDKSITTPEVISATTLREYILRPQVAHNPGGCHAHYRAMWAFLFWFEDEAAPDGWRNPIRKMKAPRVPEEILEPAPLADVRAMVAACGCDSVGLRDKTIVLALLDSGPRASELRGLDLANLEPFSGEIKIRKGKDGKGSIIFVGVKARRSIRRWVKVRDSYPGPLFPTQMAERLT